jgi:DNA processing protein
MRQCGRAVWLEQAPAPALFGEPAQSQLLQAAADDLQRWADQGLQILTILDEEYPAQLREVHQLPPVLFTRGTLVPDDRGVSLVGSRNASQAALTFTTQVAVRLVGAGLSGLAAGIDTAAHTAALAAGGRTVAFLGTGIRRHYPAANRDLQEQVAARGLLVSQFWPDAPPNKHTFLMRNAIMSGYGRATIVVEAGETSGTRHQARMAVDHGRPVILTDVVATGTTWGAALRWRPGVYVASTPGDVLAIAEQVARPLQEQVDALTSPC